MEHYVDDVLITKKSVTDFNDRLPFYLRGTDFTKQMQDFTSTKSIIANVRDALITRQIINNIISA
jgi:hypothetical protein